MVGLFWTFLFSAVFTKVSTCMLEINGDVYDLNWYSYPNQSKIMLTMIIIRAQKPVYFSGFHFMTCNLESFQKVKISPFYSLHNVSVYINDQFICFDFFQLVNGAGKFFLTFRNISAR